MTKEIRGVSHGVYLDSTQRKKIVKLTLRYSFIDIVNANGGKACKECGVMSEKGQDHLNKCGVGAILKWLCKID